MDPPPVRFHASPYYCLRFCPREEEIYDRFVTPFNDGTLDINRSLALDRPGLMEHGPEQLQLHLYEEACEYYQALSYWFLVSREPQKPGSMKPRRTVGDNSGLWKSKGKAAIASTTTTTRVLGTKQSFRFFYNNPIPNPNPDFDFSRHPSGWNMTEYCPLPPAAVEGAPALPEVFQVRVVANIFYKADEDKIRLLGYDHPVPPPPPLPLIQDGEGGGLEGGQAPVNNLVGNPQQTLVQEGLGGEGGGLEGGGQPPVNNLVGNPPVNAAFNPLQLIDEDEPEVSDNLGNLVLDGGNNLPLVEEEVILPLVGEEVILPLVGEEVLANVAPPPQPAFLDPLDLEQTPSPGTIDYFQDLLNNHDGELNDQQNSYSSGLP
ncbi:NAC domain-containing protein [Hirschfeldia incana]|nr:NAC domain-containing protein [Hirschfeldia incana]